MDLFEYQARELFVRHQVPVVDAVVATTPDEARAAAVRLLDEGSSAVVVKAQVKTGGRGKAGGVAVVRSADEAAQAAERILALEIKGHPVRRVMIAAGADIAA